MLVPALSVAEVSNLPRGMNTQAGEKTGPPDEVAV